VPDWRVKALTQRALYRLPAGGRVNYLMQRHLTRTAVLRPAFARNKLEQCGRHWANWAAGSSGAVPGRVVEVGTGWFPFVIVGLALAGCREVVTVDRSPLLRPDNVAATLRAVDEGLTDGWLGEWLGRIDPGRRAVLHQLAGHDEVPADALSGLGVRMVVGDAAALPFPDGSVDLFVSNNTLEHIAEPALAAMLAEFRRVARPTARMSHFIDLSDHYSHFDSSISPLNFLRFDDRSWRRWDNGIVPQNRLRISDYRRLHERAGFTIVDEELTLADASALDAVPIAPAFAARDRDDLRTTYAWLVSVPTEVPAEPTDR
jgi:SAM-dependent methyltransferase